MGVGEWGWGCPAQLGGEFLMNFCYSMSYKITDFYIFAKSNIIMFESPHILVLVVYLIVLYLVFDLDEVSSSFCGFFLYCTVSSLCEDKTVFL